MNFPASLLSELKALPGFDEDLFLKAHGQPAPTSVRIHPVKGINLPLYGHKVPWCDNGLYLPERPIFTLDPLYHAGAYYVQEASSMFLSHLFQQGTSHLKNRRVLDLCAAPGGKSSLIASLLQREDLLISNEVIRSRASVLEENVTRWGYTNNWVTCNDPKELGSLSGYFDCVIVDAPCSGSGLFRKNKGALNEWSTQNVEMCSARQKRILSDIWPAIKEGGTLIYSTCSFSFAEDEQILDWLESSFSVTNVKCELPDKWGIITTESRGIKGYRFMPGNVDGEGFFIAAVQKNERTPNLKQNVKVKSAPAGISNMVMNYLKSSDFQLVENKEFISAVQANHSVDFGLLQNLVYFRKAGLPLGTPGSKEWLSDHALAMSLDLSTDVPALDVDRDHALKYLKREDPGIADAGKGWKVVRYQGLPLGWVKCLGNRINNNLPKHWKIRMEIPDMDGG